MACRHLYNHISIVHMYIYTYVRTNTYSVSHRRLLRRRNVGIGGREHSILVPHHRRREDQAHVLSTHNSTCVRIRTYIYVRTCIRMYVRTAATRCAPSAVCSQSQQTLYECTHVQVHVHTYVRTRAYVLSRLHSSVRAGLPTEIFRSCAAPLCRRRYNVSHRRLEQIWDSVSHHLCARVLQEGLAFVNSSAPGTLRKSHENIRKYRQPRV